MPTLDDGGGSAQRVVPLRGVCADLSFAPRAALRRAGPRPIAVAPRIAPGEQSLCAMPRRGVRA